MKRIRDLFPVNDKINNELIDEYLNEIEVVLAEFFQLELNFMIETAEDNRACLINHTISKIEIVLESCHALLDRGFYGSSNALYRQVYEYIVWLKMYISMDKESSEIISRAFFETSQDARSGKNEAVRYLKEHFKLHLPNEYIDKVSQKECKEFVTSYYSELSALTHGSRFSQQTFTPDTNDFLHLHESLFRLVTIMCMSSYSSQLAYSIYGSWDGKLGAFNEHAQQAMSIHKRCEKLLNKIDSKSVGQVPLQLVVLKGEWKYTK